MRVKAIIVSAFFLVAVSCIEKDPSWNISWGGEGSGKVTPYPGPQPQTDPDTVAEVIPTDVALLEAFAQDFGTAGTAPFSLDIHSGGEDFRYFPGFPSLSESGTEILMLRLDPADSPSQGARLTASAHTFYGSYSMRVRTPDLSRVKKTTDAFIELRLDGNDPAAGVSGIGMKWELSAPTKMTLTSVAGTLASQSSTSVAVMLKEAQDPSAKFQTCGWDWTPECVRWWILDSSTNEKTVIGELTGPEEIPFLPAVLSLSVSHSSDAPEYPFETEIDKISYEPYQDNIQAWREKYFEKR